MSTYPEAPKSPCTQYAAALPALRSGALSVSQREKLRTHLQLCDTCRQQADSISWPVIEEAMRRHFGASSEAASFLSLDDIRLRVSSLTLPEWSGHPDIHANAPIVRLVDTGAIMRTQTKRRITADEIHRPKRAANYWRASAAVMAVVALVAVFAVVVHSFTAAPHHPATGPARPATWTKQYTVRTQNSLPVVAPGDPSVVYKPGGSLAFQRSDDGGKTWTSHTAPGQKVTSDPSASLTLQVSPLDAMMVYATIWSDPSNPNCPHPGYTAETSSSSSNTLAQTLTLAGGWSCTFQYVSADGGGSWSTPVVPTEGDVGLFYFTGGPEINSPFVAQGNRLYSALSPDINGEGFRLVSSLDGIHWSAADTALAAQNLTEVEYAATPAGSTLFVTTLPNTSAGGFSRELWRSDDAGAHWTDLGAFPEAPNPEDMTDLIGAANVGTQAAVYYATVSFATSPPPTPSPGTPLYPVTGGIAPGNVYVSLDNGKTWQTAPEAGIPTGQRAAPLSLGTLRDGALVMAFDTRLRGGATSSSGGLTFYSWRPGDQTWTQRSRSLTLPSNPIDLWTKSLWLAGGQGDSPVTILALIPQDNAYRAYTLWSCAMG